MKSVAEILRSVQSGKLAINEAEELLRLDVVTILGDIARVDASRYMRRGIPEIIYGAGKSESQLSRIITGLLMKRAVHTPSKKISAEPFPIIISKIRGSTQAKLLSEEIITFNATHKTAFKFEYLGSANIATISESQTGSRVFKGTSGRVGLISAGTSDIAALDEAQVIAEILGCSTIRFNDVGVAALHRLEGPMKKLLKFDPDAIIVAAGMEGALPSVITGLSSVPVIGLPTSSGYGFGGRGEAALMSMLQACPLGIAVVNIDAGVAAGVIAYLIARRASRKLKRV